MRKIKMHFHEYYQKFLYLTEWSKGKNERKAVTDEL